ncbi:MAG: CocE/NonD family hydrolase [Alicyclobacillus sp.]|nr:CocE/NonD family hydrolase [Alicyclobacillus sp.]
MTVRFDRNVPCPMRDGVTLRANVFRPEGGGPYPVIVSRLPYGKDTHFAYLVVDPVRLAEAGYIVVIQDVRGRFASEGTYTSMTQEFTDGYDTVEWASKLPGSDGQVGMFGASYFAFTQLTAAASGHPALRAIVPTVPFDDPFDGVSFRGGALEWGLQAAWYMQMAPAELLRPDRSGPDLPTRIGRLVHDLNHLADDGYLQLPLTRFEPLRRAGVLDEFLANLEAGPESPYWNGLSIRRHYPAMQTAAYLVGGWYDVFLQCTLKSYEHLRRTGQPTRLLIGPWTHGNHGHGVGEVNFGLAAGSAMLELKGDATARHIRWFDAVLKGVENGMAGEPPVQVFVMGANRWRHESAWPLPQTVYTPFYLRADAPANTARGAGRLSAEPPLAEPADAYIYDPANPVRTHGGNILMTPEFAAGPVDQARTEARPDVLVYTSDPLTAPLEVTGPVQAKLWVASSAPDTDFVVRLTDVYPDGRSIHLADGILRMRYRHGRTEAPPMRAGEVYPIEIDLWATSNVFLPGHRIRVQVTSSNFPRWNRNLNTGASNETTAEFATAQQTIYHDADHPSHILLPVIPS